MTEEQISRLNLRHVGTGYYRDPAAEVEVIRDSLQVGGPAGSGWTIIIKGVKVAREPDLLSARALAERLAAAAELMSTLTSAEQVAAVQMQRDIERVARQLGELAQTIRRSAGSAVLDTARRSAGYGSYSSAGREVVRLVTQAVGSLGLQGVLASADHAQLALREADLAVERARRG